MPNPDSSLRIVSLIASATEILCALGWGDSLVGRSHECDYPAWVKNLPPCSAPRINVDAGSRAIDDQVRTSLRNGLSIYEVFTAELDRLAPTHIVTQTQCEVCAVSLKDVQNALCEVVSSQPQVLSLEPMNLEDLWRDIAFVAGILGDPQRGQKLIVNLKSRLSDIREFTSSTGRRPTLVCLEWLDPLMSAGNWTPELAEIAGGKMLLAEAGKHSPYFSWPQLLEADADVLAILPCGFDMPRTIRELPALTDSPYWNQLRAVRERRVFLADGNQFFNRPGPRLVESAEILAELLHPPLFADLGFQHHGTGWLPLAEAHPSF